ncbi:pneumococcal serine-rich repeat protein [Drosophila miranda]|uniref:pneumococcal serine-rich repeat protein n=1 Tax=Drosophila miranda TaxID=7229 RepID=UPI0007E5D402|nr:pneumococcal serine-rich repeat protein [Drosophila miranda]XP_017142794.1 pneumococcal serine-rich repeat protein [Drosophila miranda]
MPQTSPNWRQAYNERTKGAVSVIAARNCATGTATATASATASATATATVRRRTATLTTAEMTVRAGDVGGPSSVQRRQFLRSTRTRTASWLDLLPALLVLGFGMQLVTCSEAKPQPQPQPRAGAEPEPGPAMGQVQAEAQPPTQTRTQLMPAPRSTLSDRPMTTHNDLITTARNLTTAKKQTTEYEAASTSLSEGETSTAVARGMSSAAAAGTALAEGAAPGVETMGATKSAQIGLTTRPAEEQVLEQIEKAAQPATAATEAAATTTAAVAVAAEERTTETTTAAATATATATAAMLISTIYPASTETDGHNSIETVPAENQKKESENPALGRAELPAEDDERNSLLPLPLLHPGGADSLTKGFSIPTFLPPFPVFAAADLPAYRAAADAAAAAAAAIEEATKAAAAAAAAAASSEAATLSPEEQRRRMFDEQHSYLAAHRAALDGDGQAVRRNLTMPVLNITAQMGNHAYMPCQIHRLSDKPVSWVRMRDNHIISVDETTFIADERFQSIFQEDHDYTWSLQIKYVVPDDAGGYECQMATEPKLSAKVHLEIVTPKTELIGDQSRFVKAGSKVALHCIVRGTLDPPKYIIWFRGQKKVSESDERTGWYTQLDRNIFGTVGDNQNTIGSLIIPVVRKEDSGNYTCQPSNSVSVSVDLHVLSGEYSASAIMSTASVSWTKTRTSTSGRSTSQLMLWMLGLLGLLGALQGPLHTPQTT